MFFTLILILIGVYTAVTYWKNRKYKKLSSQILSTMPRVPFIEHAVNFVGTATDRMEAIKIQGIEALYKSETGLVGLWLANIYFIITIVNPDVVEVVLKSTADKGDAKGAMYELLGNGLLFAPVPIWRPHRKIIAAHFGQKTLNGFVDIFHRNGSVLIDKLKSDVGKGDFSIFDRFTKYSLDSICETMLGVNIDAQNNLNHPIPNALNTFCDLAGGRLLKPWCFYDAIYKFNTEFKEYKSTSDVLKKFVQGIIKLKRNDIHEKKTKLEDGEAYKAKSLLESLIATQSGFTNLELQEQSLVMVAAGTDTSSVAFAFTSLLLAKHPEVQEKIYQEAKQVFGDSDRPVEANDLPKMKYLEAVFKESMRLYPPIPVFPRKLNKDIHLPNDITLHNSTSVVIHVWALHRHPKYWGPDANEFKPERFLGDSVHHPYAYLPFGSGPRVCIGYKYAMMSMKSTMSKLVRKYRILPPENSNIFEELSVKYGIMLKHTENFKIRLELRD